jgi:hypothetical protein
MKRAIIAIASIMVPLTTANIAMAASPVGQWNVTFYIEPGLSTGNTQGMCFKSNKTWYSTTFPDWNGDWFQKGDRLRWFGDEGTIGLGWAAFGQFSAPNTMYGEFAEFTATGTPPLPISTKGNYSMTKVSSVCAPPALRLAPGRGTGATKN